MTNLLAAAASYSYSYTTTSSNTGINGGVLALIVILSLIFAVLMIASMWKLFQKAGEQGWKAIIPVYNLWTLAEIAGKPGWWSLVFLINFIPFIGPIASAVVYVIIYVETAKAFGKSPAFSLLLIFLPFIGWPMLGFGSAKYVGQKYQTIAPTPPAGPTQPPASTPPTSTPPTA